MIDFLLGLVVCMSVFLSVCLSFSSFLYITKVYIKKNALHVCAYDAVNNVYFCEATDSIQYHPPDANLD